MQEWYAFVKETAKEYKIDPNLCAALAAGESGYGDQEVRFGPVCDGKYYAPYNLHYSAFKKWNIANWKVNTKVGIWRLSELLKSHNGNLHAALQHYNTDDKGEKYDGYVANIKKLQRQYKKRRVFAEPSNNGRCQMTMR